jgi:Protein of unknown function (DUF1570)
MSFRLRTYIVANSLLLFLFAAPAADGADFMFRARVKGDTLEGKPLTWTDTEMVVLGRDGQLHVFDPRKAKDAKKIGTRFFGYSMSEMKRELHREFGKEFDITTTNHYIVVHPKGQKDQWAQRFEELYRLFNHYFRVRGFTPKEPDFPLVAIVYRNQAEYAKASAAAGTTVVTNMLGHYAPASNRVFLYDVTADTQGADWSQNATTIIHEATHQTAYNVGIHSRFTPTPSWLTEGLATLFEARGVWDSKNHPSRSDRVNRERLRDFRDYLTRRPEGSLVQLIASDQLFDTATLDAYAEAWAFTFYLCETQPRLYAEYLTKTAARPQFIEYTADERLTDFQEVFGQDMRMIERRFLRWMDDVE